MVTPREQQSDPCPALHDPFCRTDMYARFALWHRKHERALLYSLTAIHAAVVRPAGTSRLAFRNLTHSSNTRNNRKQWISSRTNERTLISSGCWYTYIWWMLGCYTRRLLFSNVATLARSRRGNSQPARYWRRWGSSSSPRSWLAVPFQAQSKVHT